MAEHTRHRHNYPEDLLSLNRAFPTGVTLLTTKSSISVSTPFIAIAMKGSQYACGEAKRETNREDRKVLCQQLD